MRCVDQVSRLPVAGNGATARQVQRPSRRGRWGTHFAVLCLIKLVLNEVVFWRRWFTFTKWADIHWLVLERGREGERERGTAGTLPDGRAPAAIHQTWTRGSGLAMGGGTSSRRRRRRRSMSLLKRLRQEPRSDDCPLDDHRRQCRRPQREGASSHRQQAGARSKPTQ